MTAQAQTVLVVEDESSIASFVALYLKNAGYGVRSAATGTVRLAGLPDTPHGDGTYSLNGNDFVSLPGSQMIDKRSIGSNG